MLSSKSLLQRNGSQSSKRKDSLILILEVKESNGVGDGFTLKLLFVAVFLLISRILGSKDSRRFRRAILGVNLHLQVFHFGF